MNAANAAGKRDLRFDHRNRDRDDDRTSSCPRCTNSAATTTAASPSGSMFPVEKLVRPADKPSAPTATIHGWLLSLANA